MRLRLENFIFCFCLFFVAARGTEKWKKAKNPTQIVLLKVVIQKGEIKTIRK